MRIRFKLRTLLIATAIIAAVFGFMINQVMNVSRERSALEKLESEWDLRIDNDNPFLMVEQGWIEQSSDWAVQKLSGIKPRRRCRQLELTSKTMDSITLMGQLRKLKHVKRLSLRFRRQGYFSSLTAPSIESNEYRHIRKMRGLQELMIDYPISDSVVQELKSMKLTKLELKAEKWTQASFDAIGDMRTLRSLHLKADRFSTENLNAIGKLNSLEALTLWTNDGYVIKRSPGKPSFRKFESPLNFESICDLPNLTWLNINGHVDKA